MNAIQSRNYYSVVTTVARSGCPAAITPYLKTKEQQPRGRQPIIHKYTMIVLEHLSKQQVVKNRLPLDKLHHELEVASLSLVGSGSSNIVVSKVSFDCLITLDSGVEMRDYISFDLKIPGANGEEGAFTFDFLAKQYGGIANLYAVMKYFYQLGQAQMNGVHGHEPDYDSNSSKHDQYIRHTEQLIVAYLALPGAASMLRQRLDTTIRSQYPGSKAVKVYNMGLHMHSTKTCCAPCEYSLVGLMNKQNLLMYNGKPYGFLCFFKDPNLHKRNQLQFIFPSRTSFQVIVTVTASGNDADHQTQPKYQKQPLSSRDTPTSFVIKVKEANNSVKIFSTMVQVPYDRRRLSVDSGLNDKTVVISGSKQTPGSPKTISKVQDIRAEELANAFEHFSLEGTSE